MVRLAIVGKMNWRLLMQVGDLVQLLDVHGEPELLTGIITGFRKGLVKVHWSGVFNQRDAAWQWGRLKVLNASR